MSHGECHHLVSYYKDCPDCKTEKEENHKRMVEAYARYLKGESLTESEAFERLEKIRDTAFSVWDTLGTFGSLRTDFVLRMIFGIEDGKPLPKNLISKSLERY